MNDEERIKNEKIARYFCENQIKAHLVRKDDIFFNGLIKEVGADFCIVEDVEDGGKLIFFNELKRPIEEFKTEEKEDGRRKNLL